jgi:paired amphipathic helix protein Sin3a
VKTLFKGHNKLILGFNTFLPEGEGYKIELNTDDVDGSEPVVTTVKVGLTSTIVDTSEHAAPKTAQANLTSNIPATTGTLLPPFATNPPVAPAVAANLLPAGAAAAATSTSPPPGQMQQAHAFHYVTKIRDRFTNEPETYR